MDDGTITEEEKVKALHLMPVPTLPLDAIEECTMSTTEHSGEQFVVRKRMMQERAPSRSTS